LDVRERLLVRHRTSEFCSGLVDLVSQIRQTELFHRHDVRIERVGLDDVRTGIKVLLMNAGDQLG
jgi:hypothetical protein